MLNIPEYKEYAGETKIALMDNSSLAFMHELSQRSYPSDRILGVYDLILIPKWVMEEIEDSTYRSTYVEQLQAQGYPIRWIDETKYGTFVNDEDVNLYYIVEAAVSRVSELMRFLRRKVKTEDLIDLPSAEEWMNRLYDEWPIHGRTLSTGRVLKKNAGEISLTILAEVFAWYHDEVDSLTIYTQDTDAHEFQTNAERMLTGMHKSARVCHLHGLFPPFRRRFSATLSGLLATRTIFLNNERGTSKNAVTTFKEVHRNDGLQENSYASKYGVQPTRNGTQ